MTAVHSSGGWVITLSFLVAFLLVGIPLPGGLGHFRPDWVAMTLIYWCMALPQRIGIGVGLPPGRLPATIHSSVNKGGGNWQSDAHAKNQSDAKGTATKWLETP